MWPENIKKSIITLQVFSLKLPVKLSNSMMQLSTAYKKDSSWVCHLRWGQNSSKSVAKKSAVLWWKVCGVCCRMHKSIPGINEQPHDSNLACHGSKRKSLVLEAWAWSTALTGSEQRMQTSGACYCSQAPLVCILLSAPYCSHFRSVGAVLL